MHPTVVSKGADANVLDTSKKAEKPVKEEVVYPLDAKIPLEASIAKSITDMVDARSLKDEDGNFFPAVAKIAEELKIPVEEVTSDLFAHIKEMRIIWLLRTYEVSLLEGNREVIGFTPGEAEAMLQTLAPSSHERIISKTSVMRIALGYLIARVNWHQGRLGATTNLNPFDQDWHKAAIAMVSSKAGFEQFCDQPLEPVFWLIKGAYKPF